MNNVRPKLFISYSHDSDDHKEWVEKLATRLEGNGVHVILDQWDLGLGSDLALFMEQGLSSADRVMVVCTEPYVEKANSQKAGVGYEKMIISSQIMNQLGDNRVIPIIINNKLSNPVPIFVGTRLRLYFDESNYEKSYAELIHDLHGQRIKVRPPAGENPFLRQASLDDKKSLSIPGGRNHSTALSGKVTLSLPETNGVYWLGSGAMIFELKWSSAGRGSAHIYNRQKTIKSLIFAKDIKEISQITNVLSNKFFKCVDAETLTVGDIVILQNIEGYYLAVKLEKVLYRDRNADDRDEITFSYRIAPAKSTSFASIE
ncbi:MAG: toll/interleukin-1 receptor domain-containing protein [Bacilli bacterium]